MKLVMTVLVRDSEELLRSNLEFHLAQGVDFFVITDNGSVDSTPSIIDEYVRAGLAEAILEPEDTYSQGRWVTRMARLAAARHGADWVINNDDDEFWFAREGDLKQLLARVPEGVPAVEASRRNHPPLAGAEGLDALEAMIYCERTSLNPLGEPLPSKVCHRGFADVEVAQGNHLVFRSGAPLASMRADAIAISHFPVRGYAAFAHKIALGGAAYERNADLDPKFGATWRWLYGLLRQGKLREWYDRQVLDHEQLARGLSAGALVVDDHVARSLGALRNLRCTTAA
jgi:hypothetical protein